MRLRRIGRIVTLVLGLLVAPCAAAASTPVPRIVVLSQFAPPAQPSPAFEGLRAGLRELGYTEGRTVVLEYRYAEGRYARLSPLVTALVRLSVDVIVALNAPALALQHRPPTVALFRDFAEAGCLIGYGPNLQVLPRRAAVYVDKLLNEVPKPPLLSVLEGRHGLQGVFGRVRQHEPPLAVLETADGDRHLAFAEA
jgi:hypothetical protein